MLNGAASVMPGELSCPWNTATKAGHYVSASIPVRVLFPNRPRLRFAERDDFTGPTAGYHFKQVTVDGTVVWEEDVAGGTTGWRLVDLDLGERVAGKANVTLAFRLFDKRGVSNFGVHWRVKDLHAEGLQPGSLSPQSPEWKVDKRGPLVAGFGLPPAAEQREFHIPFIVMTAASPDEFRMRHGDPANPERIAQWLRLSLQAWREGQCDGVVTYCLDKGAESQVFPLARRLFGEYRSGTR